MTMQVFREFPKISRLNREVVVTEKLDGTNGVIFVAEDGQSMLVGSRTRWITPEDDNYGFAKWARVNEPELLKLGPGFHYGEWWGQGIQRKYGLSEKRFSLFNVHRWSDDTVRPTCCHVVPVLQRGSDIRVAAEQGLEVLRQQGSIAAHGFPKPEGIVVFHTAAMVLFKVTLEKDEEPKGR